MIEAYLRANKFFVDYNEVIDFFSIFKPLFELHSEKSFFFFLFLL